MDIVTCYTLISFHYNNTSYTTTDGNGGYSYSKHKCRRN